ncbi:urease accessory protein [Microbacterium saccharophilum]|uniref:Urease accessory protein n=1 Tax=Microbacterium saccharophilum TaxID=1213358 RepID=A0A5C8I7P6_9MICO|nr:urease accessory UreF family protein [Microbacterium saccharophilum]TXK13915.1 urease accessory protein [Microbacterium saccharophilum]GEP48947.1 urease accessory protein UreF [Microbacterium saccharophilum]
MDSATHTVSLLLADARLPSGGHAFSAGVEPAIQGGLPRADVGAFLRARALTTTRVDAATAVVARRAGLTGGSYAPVERAWAARTPSRAARTASMDLGRGLLRLAQRLWPQSPAITALSARGAAAAPRPIVLGAIAAHTGLDAETLVRVAVYDDMAGGVAALLKLEPGDPVEGVRLVMDACAAVDPFIEQLAMTDTPAAIPAASAPQAEAWTELHAATNRRLFRG